MNSRLTRPIANVLEEPSKLYVVLKAVYTLNQCASKILHCVDASKHLNRNWSYIKL